MSADVAGYSRLMGKDESRTLAALKSHRRDLIDPKISEYGGRIVKTTGDGLLLEFPSVVDAVRCAVDVQRGMTERNAGIPRDEQIQFRVGINVGDIIIDADDIFGDGVNVAARLEALALPGGICVSRAVRDHVLDKLSFRFEDLGPQQVKNIARPVEVFRVNLDGSGAPTSRALGWQPVRRTWRWLATGGVALVIAGVALWTLRYFDNGRSPATKPAMSVAIMSLAAAEADPSDVQAAETLRGELIARLVASGRNPIVLRVDDRGSELDVGRRYNVRYVIQGDVRAGNGGKWLQLTLVDAQSSAQVWGGRYALVDGTGVDHSSTPIRKMAGAVRDAMYSAEMRRVAGEPVERLGAVELVIRGVYSLQQPGPAAPSEAQKLFDTALQRDPNLVEALVWKSNVLDMQLDIDPSRDRDRVAREMDDLTAKALTLRADRSFVWTSRSVALAAGGRWNAAIEAIDEAIRLDPDNPQLYAYKAQWMVYTGRPGEGLQLVDQAMSLNPDYVGWSMWVACEAHLFLGHADQAIAACERAAPNEPIRLVQLFLAAAHANQGDIGKASAALQLAMQKTSVRTIAQMRERRYSEDPEYLKLAEMDLYPGLMKAGMPER